MKGDESFLTKASVWLALAAMLPGFALMLSGVLQLGGQILHWARSGVWQALPAVLLFGPKQDWPLLRVVPDLYWSEGFINWLTMPNDWKGVAGVLLWLLNWLPSPIVCLVLGFGAVLVPLWVGSAIASEVALWREGARAKSGP